MRFYYVYKNANFVTLWHSYGMNAVLIPIISEFETENQAASYDLWFRAKVKQALDSKSPRIPHHQVMAEMEAIIVKAVQQ